MKKQSFLAGLCLAVPVWAQERLEVTESIDVSAPAAQVWDAVKGFDSLDSWHPAVTKTEITTGEPTQRGAIRVLTIGDGAGTVQETLTAYEDDAMSFSYVINSTDVLPVKDYAATVKVLSVSDNLSLVIWAGNFLANPAEGQPDSSAQDTMAGVYRAGLENLKSMLE